MICFREAFLPVSVVANLMQLFYNNNQNEKKLGNVCNTVNDLYLKNENTN